MVSGTIVLDNNSRMVGDREHHQTAQNLYETDLDGTNAGMTSDGGRIS